MIVLDDLKSSARLSISSTLDELHGADGAQEEDGGNHQGMDGQPTESEDGIGHRGPGHCRSPGGPMASTNTKTARKKQDCGKKWNIKNKNKKHVRNIPLFSDFLPATSNMAF